MTERRKGPHPEEPAERALVLRRAFETSRQRIFKAWIDPKHAVQWWGPSGFTNPICELDVRPGGGIRIDMRGLDGTVYPMTGANQEIVQPQQLIFTRAALDDRSNPLFKVLNTVTFADLDRETTQTLRARVVNSTPEASPPGDRRCVRGDSRATRRQFSDRCQGSRRGDRHHRTNSKGAQGYRRDPAG